MGILRRQWWPHHTKLSLSSNRGPLAKQARWSLISARALHSVSHCPSSLSCHEVVPMTLAASNLGWITTTTASVLWMPWMTQHSSKGSGNRTTIESWWNHKNEMTQQCSYQSATWHEGSPLHAQTFPSDTSACRGRFQRRGTPMTSSNFACAALRARRGARPGGKFNQAGIPSLS